MWFFPGWLNILVKADIIEMELNLLQGELSSHCFCPFAVVTEKNNG